MAKNGTLISRLRQHLNARGAPFFRALPVEDFAEWRERVAAGASRIGGDPEEYRQWAALVAQPQQLHPWIQSVLLIGCNTNDEYAQPEHAPDEPYGRVARWLAYLGRLPIVGNEAVDIVREAGFQAVCEGDAYYPVRPAVVRAGFGRFRRNNFVYHQRHGSWLGWTLVFTDAGFDYGTFEDSIWGTDICAECPEHCIAGCPTKALAEPYHMDPNKCVRAWNLATVPSVPREVRAGFGNWLGGCDACQEACPQNRNAPVCPRPEFAKAPMPGDMLFPNAEPRNYVPLLPLLKRQPGPGENAVFANMRRRNAAIILGATRDERGLPALRNALHDPAAAVRAHAAWALGRLAELGTLRHALEREPEQWVREEIEWGIQDPG